MTGWRLVPPAMLATSFGLPLPARLWPGATPPSCSRSLRLSTGPSTPHLLLFISSVVLLAVFVSTKIVLFASVGRPRTRSSPRPHLLPDQHHRYLGSWRTTHSIASSPRLPPLDAPRRPPSSSPSTPWTAELRLRKICLPWPRKPSFTRPRIRAPSRKTPSRLSAPRKRRSAPSSRRLFRLRLPLLPRRRPKSLQSCLRCGHRSALPLHPRPSCRRLPRPHARAPSSLDLPCPLLLNRSTALLLKSSETWLASY